MTVPASLAGLPAISIPVERGQLPSPWAAPNSLPVSLQLIGRAFDESRLLQAAFALEQAAQFEPLPFQTVYK